MFPLLPDRLQGTGLSVPAFSPVEGVIAATGRYAVFYVNGSAEELETVIRTLVSLAIFYCGAVAYAIEGETIGFVFLIESVSAVFDTHVAQCAGVVGIVVTPVNGTAYFRAACAAGYISVCISADVDTTPGSGFFLFGGHYDGVFGSTLRIDLGTLFYEDVVYDVIVFGDDGYTRFYFQCGAIFTLYSPVR